MKTRITQNIDGYDIIVGIGEAQIDGVKTEPIAIEALKQTDIYKQVEAIKNDYMNIVSAGKKALENARSAKTISDKNLYVKEYQSRIEESKEKETEISILIPELQNKQRELIIKHAVYFQPAKCETIITDEDAEIINNAMISASEKNCHLDINLKEIADYRALTAWKNVSSKWSKREILTLGDKPSKDEILQNDLTESQQLEIGEQMETERISKLTSTEKSQEKAAALQNLVSRANQMRGELEIVGDSKALVKSQEWYNAEAEKVNIKYAP